jgi:hypothetical protein
MIGSFASKETSLFPYTCDSDVGFVKQQNFLSLLEQLHSTLQSMNVGMEIQLTSLQVALACENTPSY